LTQFHDCVPSLGLRFSECDGLSDHSLRASKFYR
jgi:hypothetical protein